MFKIKDFLNGKEITEKDISYDNDYPDRINSNCLLFDYDWMYYILEFILPVCGRKENPENYTITGRFVYSGMVDCDLDLQQGNDKISFRFKTEIFEKHISEYMKAHIGAWKEEYAFNGGKQVLDFINEVVKNHISVSVDDECRFEKIEMHPT